MTQDRRASVTWTAVRGTSRVGYRKVDAVRAWCRQHVGVERADWEYLYGSHTWRFRDAEMAFLFQLTWG
jgi:2-keto-4-pentenoate hydratase